MRRLDSTLCRPPERKAATEKTPSAAADRLTEGSTEETSAVTASKSVAESRKLVPGHRNMTIEYVG